VVAGVDGGDPAQVDTVVDHTVARGHTSQRIGVV
jgi:hypothetical protein